MDELKVDVVGKGWIGVDLDGTLAHYDGWKGADHIGEPIERMVNRVKKWLEKGMEVRIVTARCHPQNSAKTDSMVAIHKWCQKHIGEKLMVTWEKDFNMIELWDDRAVQVVPNTGMTLKEHLEGIVGFELKIGV